MRTRQFLAAILGAFLISFLPSVVFADGPTLFLPGGHRQVPVIEAPLWTDPANGRYTWDTRHLGLDRGGHLESTAFPGQFGNSTIVGHSGGDFGILHDARVGQLATYSDGQGIILTYTVTENLLVEKRGGAHWAFDKGDERLTLITTWTKDLSRLIILRRVGVR